MDKPVISVVIPTFNSEKYLYEAIESVVNQSHNNLEILILDDGSSDNTIEIIKSFADVRIKLFESKVNQGQSHQLNKGIIKATGEYVCIMHSDDVMHVNKLERQLIFLKNNPLIGVCGCNVQLIGEKNDIWIYPEKNQACKDLLLSSVPFAHPAVVFRKSVLSEMGFIYDQKMVPTEDYDLWVRLANKTLFGNVQEVLLRYRIHPNQIGNTEKKKQEKLLDEIRQKMIVQLFNIDEKDSNLCFNSLYYTGQIKAADAAKGVKVLWVSNKKKGMFSNQVLKGRLKHIIFKLLSGLNFKQRIQYIAKNSAIFEIIFFKTMLRILLLKRKNDD